MRTAIIIGAGPAGLTAAYELLEHSDIIPIILESEDSVGGLSKTINYNGNRIDIGGHRFFSKSEVVMKWWQNKLPVESNGDDILLTYHNQHVELKAKSSTDKTGDNAMLIRHRLSRIFFAGKFFNYPLNLSLQTLNALGLKRTVSIIFSYLKSKISPRTPEATLEDFYINRFGKVLYNIFFKDYTEKVWGVPVTSISASWGAQRIKGLSLSKTILHAFLRSSKKRKDIHQKETETSLIEKFLYPKFGPGQMWQVVAEQITGKGGIILKQHQVKSINNGSTAIVSITAINTETNEEIRFDGDFFFSTMPIKDLLNGFLSPLNLRAHEIANKLTYRDFITVGLLLKELKIKNKDGSAIKDNWIYIQEKNVKLGRLQIFNNWSPYMVSDPTKIWIGLEYFCDEGDALWNLSEQEMIELAKTELQLIKIIDKEAVEDAVVIKVPKTYPSYVGSYDEFHIVKTYVNTFENLFLIGRNGMHKYNNQDHSMLTAMQAVQNIKNGITDKSNIWSINMEDEYHEEK